MANKEFLVSVADIYLYDENDNIIASAKTLVDSSLESTLANTDIRGGKGNPLQYIYYHSPDMNITLNDVQFNLDFLAKNVGSTLTTGANVYTEENVTLGVGGAGTVAGTPLAIQATTIYGWVTLRNGTVERVTFTGQNFTCSGAQNDVVCVRYYVLDSAAKSITINANMIPSIGRLVLDAQLASSTGSSTNVIGRVQFIFPKVTMTGNFTMSMTADGVSQTPLAARVLAFTPTDANTGCSTADVFGYINKITFNTNWYDDVIALAIVGGDFSLAVAGTKTLVVKSLHSDGSVGTPPVADLTFSTTSGAIATVSSAGLVTGVSAGTATISVTITAKTAIDASVKVTVA